MGPARSLTVAVLAVALAAGLFLLLREDGGDDPAANPAGETNTGTGSHPSAAAPGDGSTPGPGTKPPPKPQVATILVEGGEPLGGIQELEFTKGERIRFVVRSDVADHVHLHGYDVFRDVPAGGEVEFDVPATIEGVFEVELEDRVVPLAEVTVNP